MKLHTPVLSLILAASVLSAATPAAGAEEAASPTGLLQRARSVYDEQLVAIDRDFNDAVGRLNADYLQAVEKLLQRFQSEGNLDATLALRNEKLRFEDRGMVTERDVVSSPEALAPLQRSCMAGLERLEEDRLEKRARLDRSYVEHLGKIVKTLTQQGMIEAASEANRELKQAERSAELPTPRQEKEAPPAKPTSAAAPGPAPASPEGPKLPKPPNDYMWVYVTEKGYPARNVWVAIQPMSGGKLTRLRTDASGKISLYAKTAGAGPFRLFLLDDGDVRQVVENAQLGKSYAMRLTPAGPGSARAPVNNGAFVIPHAGSFALGGSWTKNNGQKVQVIRSDQAEVRFEGVLRTFGPNAVVEEGKTFTVRLKDGTAYDVSFFRDPAGNPRVEYTKR